MVRYLAMRKLRVALLLSLVVAIFWLYASGTYQNINLEGFRQWLRAQGVFGGVLFVLAYSFLQPLGINGLLFLLSAPAVWNGPEAFALNWIGTIGCGLTSFVFARFVAREWVQRRIPAKIRRFDERLAHDGFRTVFLLRLIFYTNPALQYALGVSHVRTRPFLLGSALGVLPFTLFITFAGARVAQWLGLA